MEIEESFANYDIVVKAVIQKIMKKDVEKFKLLITDRPDPANNRERLGDWEADTVMGQTGKACLENISRKLWILINQIAMLKQK